MIFIKNGTINTITNGIIKGDILVENKKIKEEILYKFSEREEISLN